MGLLDRFKKYINGDEYDEDEDLEYYEDENEEDDVVCGGGAGRRCRSGFSG